MSGEARRERIHAALQEAGPMRDPDAEEDLSPGALLSGWALVCEWVDTDGEKWMEVDSADTIAGWHARGLHLEAIIGYVKRGPSA